MSLFCNGCNKQIENQSYAIQAIGRNWHKECFTCKKCNIRLFSFSKFFEDGLGFAVCATCNVKAGPQCWVCKTQMSGDYLTVGAQKWTVHKGCFKCAGCGKDFDQSGFTDDEGKLYHLQCLK